MVTPAPAMHACLRRLLPALLIFPLAAHGTVVTTTTDEDNGSLGGGTGVSLREAVIYSPVGHIITFAPALSGKTIRLRLGNITIADSLTIDGSALTTRITLSGDKTGNGRTPDDTNIFDLGTGTILLKSLVISRGYKTAEGGAIYGANGSANLTVDGCHFVGNFAQVHGGAIFLVRFNLIDDPTLTLRNSTFSGNSCTRNGGALYSIVPVQIQNSTFNANTAQTGGAIFLASDNSSFQDSTFTGNSVTTDGGAIHLDAGSIILERSTVAGNSATRNGGGIYSRGNGILLERTTISGNAAQGSGGGICTFSGYTDLENSTIAMNTAASHGGGIFVRNTMEARNCTIAANTAGISGGGLAEGAAYLQGTLVCGNNAPSSPDVQLRDVDTEGNLITPILSLAPLGNYGGSTQTMPPLIGSPAIDPFDSTSSINTDQRGYPRIGPRDIGAVEYQGDRDPYDDASITYQHLPLLWNADADRDGLPYAIERLHGTNPFVPDTSSASTLSSPVLNSEGKPVLTFIASRSAGVPETHTFWYLMRSPDLSPGSWSEIYRFTPYGGYAKPGVTFTQVPDPAGGEKIRITVTDGNPLPGGGFYRFEAVLGPP